MNKTVQNIIKLLAVLLVIVLTGLWCCVKRINKQPYQQMDFYKQELSALNKVDGPGPLTTADTVQTGWSSVNLQPPFTTPIAIDDKRGGKHFDGIHDSIYVRAFVFKQGNAKVAYISADLLIIPPTVTHLFDSILKNQGFDNSNIYFTATHTHTSIGGWYPSYVGELFAGKYDTRVPAHIASCISTAILQAEKNCKPAKIGYAEYPTHQLVFNRLVGEKGKVDSLLRVVKIEQEGGAKAAIITFSAHCTVFHANLMELSADWAGLMMTALNKTGKIGFASFSAGEVGSHGPFPGSKNQEEEAQYMAHGVGAVVLQNFDSIPTEFITSMRMIHLSLYLRKPDLRVTPHLVVRPWLFYKLFGKEEINLNMLQLGDIVFAGTPCDFSGELILPVDSVAKRKNLHLVVTSFNGGYMGYVTDSKWYNLNTYETRTMGWFGPGNGDYMSEIIERMMEKIRDDAINDVQPPGSLKLKE